jgi:copper chaperone CopZ
VSTVLANSFAGRLLPKARTVEREAPELHTLELRVPSMHCEGCLSTITRVVSRLPEVETVEGDLEGKTVTVHYRDGRTAPDETCTELSRSIRQAIDQAGFPVG